MDIKKKAEGFGINVGYSIDVSENEYEIIIAALQDGEALCQEHASYDDMNNYKAMREKLEVAKKRYLKDEETKGMINCLCCKNCLPPIMRKNGKMCKLNECKYEQA